MKKKILWKWKKRIPKGLLHFILQFFQKYRATPIRYFGTIYSDAWNFEQVFDASPNPPAGRRAGRKSTRRAFHPFRAEHRGQSVWRVTRDTRHLTRLNPSIQWFLETRGVDRPRKKRSKRSRREGDANGGETGSKVFGKSIESDREEREKHEDEEEGEDIAVRNPERTSRSAVPPYNFDLQRREESNMAADSFYAVNSEPCIFHFAWSFSISVRPTTVYSIVNVY